MNNSHPEQVWRSLRRLVALASTGLALSAGCDGRVEIAPEEDGGSLASGAGGAGGAAGLPDPGGSGGPAGRGGSEPEAGPIAEAGLDCAVVYDARADGTCEGSCDVQPAGFFRYDYDCFDRPGLEALLRIPRSLAAGCSPEPFQCPGIAELRLRMGSQCGQYGFALLFNDLCCYEKMVECADVYTPDSYDAYTPDRYGPG